MPADITTRVFRVMPRNQAPSLTLAPAIIVLNGGNAPDLLAGVNAEDDEDGDLRHTLVISGAVDPSTPGLQTIQYRVQDSTGASTVATRQYYILPEDAAVPVTLDVPATANLYSGSNAPSIALPADVVVTITTSAFPDGRLKAGAAWPEAGLDGFAYSAVGVARTDAPGHNGFSGTTAPRAMFLAGMFADGATPEPTAIDFDKIGVNFPALSPEMQQTFFLGDGLADQNQRQFFYSPSSPSELRLGFIEPLGGSDYADNSGVARLQLAIAPTNSGGVSVSREGIMQRWQAVLGDASYSEAFDLNTDGRIDLLDLVAFEQGATGAEMIGLLISPPAVSLRPGESQHYSVAVMYSDGRSTALPLGAASLNVGSAPLLVSGDVVTVAANAAQGEWTVTASVDGLETAATIIVSAPLYSISGYASGDVTAGLSVALSGPVTSVALTDAEGFYQFSGLPAGAYQIQPLRQGVGFNPALGSVEIVDADRSQDFVAESAIPDAGEGEFLVIDLSAGPGAPIYPVSYAGELPAAAPDAIVLRRVVAGGLVSQDFYSAVHAIGEAQWDLVMGASTETRRSWDEIRGGNWPGADRQPASASFVGKLRAKTGLAIDLPTEAQWSFAVGQNDSAEWCLDWFDAVADSAIVDPVGAADGVSSFRVIRGGTAVRDAALPQLKSTMIGFRLVATR